LKGKFWKNLRIDFMAGGRGMAERDFSYFVLLEILGELEISLNRCYVWVSEAKGCNPTPRIFS
jgi:hypothetical protein